MKTQIRENLDFMNAIKLFHEVSVRVPAYAKFLKSNNINPSKIKNEEDFSKLPWTDKKNYISKYPLNELCWDGVLQDLSYVVTSSGSTGTPHYWPRGNEQDLISSALYERVFLAFGINQGPTLLVNSYGQGTWIAGTEFYNAARQISQKYKSVTVINPGVDAKVAVEQIAKLSPFFSNIIIAGYPPLLKDLIDLGYQAGLMWSEINLHLITAGEAISQDWRRKVCEIIGRKGDLYRIYNVYGMADAGVVAAETNTTIDIRERAKDKNWEGLAKFGGSEMTALFQYDSKVRFFQLSDNNELLLSTRAGLPLVRYNTKDQGGIVQLGDALNFLGDYSAEVLDLPFLYLYGRKDLAVQFYSVNIFPENVRAALDSKQSPKGLTGRFVMSVRYKRNMDQVLRVEVELSKSAKPNSSLKPLLRNLIVDRLKVLNSEYRELSSKIAKKAYPQIILKDFGTIGYIPGKKHKWVKKD